jgi:hypothetical protein
LTGSTTAYGSKPLVTLISDRNDKPLLEFETTAAKDVSVGAFIVQVLGDCSSIGNSAN